MLVFFIAYHICQVATGNIVTIPKKMHDGFFSKLIKKKKLSLHHSSSVELRNIITGIFDQRKLDYKELKRRL